MDSKIDFLCEISQKFALTVILILLCVLVYQNKIIIKNTQEEKCIINEYFIENDYVDTELIEVKDVEVDYNVYDTILSQLTDEEWEILYRVARSEAGANSREAQQNVVKVVLNRIFDERFPNSIKEVVYQDGQFEVVSNGSINAVEISDFTIVNVQDAFLDYNLEIDDAEGALFFTTGKFDREYLFTDEVGHNFYK